MSANSLSSSPSRGVAYYTPNNPNEFFSPQGVLERESSRCVVVIQGATQRDHDFAGTITSTGFVHAVNTTFVEAGYTYRIGARNSDALPFLQQYAQPSQQDLLILICSMNNQLPLTPEGGFDSVLSTLFGGAFNKIVPKKIEKNAKIPSMRVFKTKIEGLYASGTLDKPEVWKKIKGLPTVINVPFELRPTEDKADDEESELKRTPLEEMKWISIEERAAVIETLQLRSSSLNQN